jgi:uncharacterized coiled-coil protein SlyX
MKYYFLIASAALLLSACNRKELADSNHEKDSLMGVVSEREASLNDFITSFNEVERNLDSVAAKQHVIVQTTDKAGELKPNQKARINDEIAAINALMEQNRKKIVALNSKLKSSSNKNVQLEKTIETLNEQLVRKYAELKDLNARLDALNAQCAQLETSVNILTADNDAKSQTISDETTALHTAYYVVGKTKELKDDKIIDRKGGLLGIGKTSKIAGDFDNSKFTKIDYTQTTSIPVNSEMKIITSHPSDSYTLDKDASDKDKVTNIVITNSEKFWSTSKYLVVVKD